MTTEKTAPTDNEIHGSFDGIRDGYVEGWAYCPGRPDQPVTIEILTNDKVVATAVANIHRSDLEDAGIGNGCHSFSIPENSDWHGGPYQIREAATGHILPVREVSESPEPFFEPNFEIMGFFDQVVDHQLSGWVFRPDQPDTALTVEVVCEHRVIARETADTFRQDLLDGGIGNGHHAFSIPVESFWNLSDCWVRESTTGKVLMGNEIIQHPRFCIPFDDAVNELQQVLSSANIPEESAHQIMAQFEDSCQAIDRGTFAWARAVLNGLIQDAGAHAVLLCKLGETFLLADNPQKALNAYQQAIFLDDHFFWAHWGMGEAYIGLNRQEDAKTALAKAKNASSHHPEIQRAIGASELVFLPQKFAQIRKDKGDPAALSFLARQILDFSDTNVIDMALEILGKGEESFDLPGLTEASKVEVCRKLLAAVLVETENRMNIQVTP